MPYHPTDEEHEAQVNAWQRSNDREILKSLTRIGFAYLSLSDDDNLRRHLSFYSYESPYNEEMTRICRLVDNLREAYDAGEILTDTMLLHVLGDNDLAYIYEDVNIVYHAEHEDCPFAEERSQLVTKVREFIYGGDL